MTRVMMMLNESLMVIIGISIMAESVVMVVMMAKDP